MINQTKKLFDAPWIRCKIEIEGKMQPCVSARTNHTVAISFDEKDANRLARLPELYDALAEATRRYCSICRYEPIEIENLVKNGCPKTHYKNAYVVSCVALDWLELLRKVRDGE